MKPATVGKALITATAAEQMIGPYLFDFNETHIYNESWPPHAKFHNAWTNSSGAARLQHAGAFAEYVIVDQKSVAHKPDTLTLRKLPPCLLLG